MPKYVIERDIPRGSEAVAKRPAGHLSEVSWRVAAIEHADPVSAQLCDRRQDLLRLHRPKRRVRRGARVA